MGRFFVTRPSDLLPHRKLLPLLRLNCKQMTPCCYFGAFFSTDHMYWTLQAGSISSFNPYTLLRPNFFFFFFWAHQTMWIQSKKNPEVVTHSLQTDLAWLGHSLDWNWRHIGGSSCSSLGTVVHISQDTSDNNFSINVSPVIYLWSLWAMHTHVGHGLCCSGILGGAGGVSLLLHKWDCEPHTQHLAPVLAQGRVYLGFILTVVPMRIFGCFFFFFKR